jgi:hypothetical protein
MTNLSKKTTKMEKKLKVLLGGYIVSFKRVLQTELIQCLGHSKQLANQAP